MYSLIVVFLMIVAFILDRKDIKDRMGKDL